MKIRPYFKFVVLFFLIFNFGKVEGKVNFENISIEIALQKARSEGKLVFVDTYAVWCAPCKVMDKLFEEESISNHFNKNFINIKIDMDGPNGQYFLNKYNVVWLPTLLILNSDGEVITKIDKLLSSEELLRLSKEAVGGLSSSISGTSLNSTPFPSSGSDDVSSNDYDPNSKEEVIYVFDQRASSGRPHIMYEEAYLHLQLMDGKHQRVVKKYLSTQEDWSTEKNIRFIFDFLQDINSEEFRYFIENKNRFEEVIGKKKVDRSLAILIHQRLEQGFPRPTLNEVKRLFNYIDPSTSETKAYSYYLGKLYSNQQELEFINLAEKYIAKVNPYDHEVIYKIVAYKMKRSDHKKHIEQNIEYMLTALSLDYDNIDYLYTISNLYWQVKKNALALQYIDRSLELATANGINPDKFLVLREQIRSL